MAGQQGNGQHIVLYPFVAAIFFQVLLRRLHNFFEFCRGNGLLGEAEAQAGTGFYFNKVQAGCFGGHNVNFAMAMPPVTVQHGKTPVLKPGGRHRLAVHACFYMPAHDTVR